MDLVTIAQIAFAVTAVVTAASLAAAALDRIGRRLLIILAALVGSAAVVAWVAFVLRPQSALAVVAGGMTIAFLARAPRHPVP